MRGNTSMEDTLIITSFWPDPAGGPTLGHFDIQMSDGLRLCGMRLTRQSDGQYRISAPKVGTRRAATFTPSVASKITSAAVAHMKGEQPYASQSV